ncbi:MAG TPA: alanine racemase [Mycobacteriales bacterium]|nr:alanine racemase [Mycobacteriales bacterium]
MTTVDQLPTPALLVERALLDENLRRMAEVLPGTRLRPHVKAFKTTALARRMADLGHTGFTCATVREVEGMAAAGLGQDLLLANEVLDCTRIGAVVEAGARVTVAVDSELTVAAAAAGGVREVCVDVNVGLPRCGVDPEGAGALADYARSKGLTVRGVMGYEGHVMLVEDRADKARQVEECMAKLLKASADVGGDLVSAGGTGTFDLNTWAGEIQAGSYCLMDTAYAAAGAPFAQALTLLATVISANAGGWFVSDVGLKSLGMDHGNPTVPGAAVWYCADEHTVFSADGAAFAVGQRIRVLPAHVDPTVALHERMHLVEGEQVLETWEIDLRGW